jgi:hypothetical protein
MVLVDACSSELDVEDATRNDVEGGYYCSRLVDHSELKPIDVSTSFHPKNETRLAKVVAWKLYMMWVFFAFSTYKA